MTETTTDKRRPTHEIRLGGVKAAIWKNQSAKAGTWYSVTFARLYKQGDSWKRSDSFGPSELPLVTQVAEMATQWIQAMPSPLQSNGMDHAEPSAI
jgi:hypothetical protein